MRNCLYAFCPPFSPASIDFEQWLHPDTGREISEEAAAALLLTSSSSSVAHLANSNQSNTSNSSNQNNHDHR